MVCKNCGTVNLDIASFCEQCGEPITYIPPQITISSDMPHTEYPPQTLPADNNQILPPQPYLQNPVYEQPLRKCIKKGQIIACFVLSIIFTAVPSIVLTSLALLFRGKYDSALKYNDFPSADSHVSKIKIFMIISWILLGLTALAVIANFVITLLAYYGVISDIFNDSFSNGTYTSLIF